MPVGTRVHTLRALHACAIVLFAIHGAAFAHAFAGGGAPHIAALLLSLAFSMPLGLLLSRLRLRRPHLVLALLIAMTQAVYHSLFAFFGEATPPGRLPVSLAAHHHGLVVLSVPNGPDGAGVSATPLMVISHVIAAALTVLFAFALQRAAARALSRRVAAFTPPRMLISVFRRMVATVSAMVPSIAALRIAARHDLPPRLLSRSAIVSGFLRHRGPPVASTA